MAAIGDDLVLLTPGTEEIVESCGRGLPPLIVGRRGRLPLEESRGCLEDDTEPDPLPGVLDPSLACSEDPTGATTAAATAADADAALIEEEMLSRKEERPDIKEERVKQASKQHTYCI